MASREASHPNLPADSEECALTLSAGSTYQLWPQSIAVSSLAKGISNAIVPMRSVDRLRDHERMV